MLRVIVLQRDPDLHEIIQALGSSGRLPNLLNGRQKKCDQHAGNGDHCQELEQREPTADSPANALRKSWARIPRPLDFFLVFGHFQFGSLSECASVIPDQRIVVVCTANAGYGDKLPGSEISDGLHVFPVAQIAEDFRIDVLTQETH